MELWKLNQQYFVELAICIVLIPQIFKLQLLVEDKELESSLRSQALRYLSTVQSCIEEQQRNQGKHCLAGSKDEGADGILKALITDSLLGEIGLLDIGEI